VLNPQTTAQNPLAPMIGAGLLRLPQVLAVVPVGKTTWWAGVKAGRYPQPIKISARCTAWRSSDIQRLLEGDVA
jgi:predicted DNA-binding transcriptional regulator AlpA